MMSGDTLPASRPRRRRRNDAQCENDTVSGHDRQNQETSSLLNSFQRTKSRLYAIKNNQHEGGDNCKTPTTQPTKRSLTKRRPSPTSVQHFSSGSTVSSAISNVSSQSPKHQEEAECDNLPVIIIDHNETSDGEHSCNSLTLDDLTSEDEEPKLPKTPRGSTKKGYIQKGCTQYKLGGLGRSFQSDDDWEHDRCEDDHDDERVAFFYRRRRQRTTTPQSEEGEESSHQSEEQKDESVCEEFYQSMGNLSWISLDESMESSFSGGGSGHQQRNASNIRMSVGTQLARKMQENTLEKIEEVDTDNYNSSCESLELSPVKPSKTCYNSSCESLAMSPVKSVAVLPAAPFRDMAIINASPFKRSPRRGKRPTRKTSDETSLATSGHSCHTVDSIDDSIKSTSTRRRKKRSSTSEEPSISSSTHSCDTLDSIDSDFRKKGARRSKKPQEPSIGGSNHSCDSLESCSSSKSPRKSPKKSPSKTKSSRLSKSSAHTCNTLESLASSSIKSPKKSSSKPKGSAISKSSSTGALENLSSKSPRKSSSKEEKTGVSRSKSTSTLESLSSSTSPKKSPNKEKKRGVSRSKSTETLESVASSKSPRKSPSKEKKRGVSASESTSTLESLTSSPRKEKKRGVSANASSSTLESLASSPKKEKKRVVSVSASNTLENLASSPKKEKKRGVSASASSSTLESLTSSPRKEKKRGVSRSASADTSESFHNVERSGSSPEVNESTLIDWNLGKRLEKGFLVYCATLQENPDGQREKPTKSRRNKWKRQKYRDTFASSTAAFDSHASKESLKESNELLDHVVEERDTSNIQWRSTVLHNSVACAQVLSHIENQYQSWLTKWRLEERKCERARKLDAAKERIRKQQEEDEARRRALEEAEQEGPSIEQRLEYAFEWYNRCGFPTRSNMKQRISKMTGCNITPDDVDLLPWNESFTRVDIKQRGKTVGKTTQGYRSPQKNSATNNTSFASTGAGKVMRHQ